MNRSLVFYKSLRSSKILIRRVLLLIEYVQCHLPERKHFVLEYPHTIQLPITHLCNFDCVMCGMHRLIKKEDFSASELEEILRDKLYKKIKSIGINGGEPFLKKDLCDCINVILDSIPTLRYINFISNGYYTDLILEKLTYIKARCRERNVKLHVSFSVDGIDDMQNFMRGRNDAWEHIVETLNRIQEMPHLFYDKLDVICTITKFNIYRINEVEQWAIDRNIEVSYNIATVNARIDNYDKVNSFTIFNDEEARMLTQEFFYKKFRETNSKKYFGIYLFVKTNKRYAICVCAYNGWVTLTPDGQLGYCATHSKKLGDAKKYSSYDMFNKNVDYLMELTNKECNHCSHYIYKLNREGEKLYCKELLKYYRF